MCPSWLVVDFRGRGCQVHGSFRLSREAGLRMEGAGLQPFNLTLTLLGWDRGQTRKLCGRGASGWRAHSCWNVLCRSDSPGPMGWPSELRVSIRPPLACLPQDRCFRV